MAIGLSDADCADRAGDDADTAARAGLSCDGRGIRPAPLWPEADRLRLAGVLTDAAGDAARFETASIDVRLDGPRHRRCIEEAVGRTRRHACRAERAARLGEVDGGVTRSPAHQHSGRACFDASTAARAGIEERGFRSGPRRALLARAWARSTEEIAPGDEAVHDDVLLSRRHSARHGEALVARLHTLLVRGPLPLPASNGW